MLDTERICGMSVPELKSSLTARELDTEGLKPALMARLEAHEAPRRAARGEKRPAPESFDNVPTCPICMDMLRGEIFQCADGHIICSDCKSKLPGGQRSPACPTCRVQLGDIRNRAMEDMIGRMRMPCRFHDKGCAVAGVKSELSRHELECECNPEMRPCPLLSCSHRCKPEQMVSHLKDSHRINVDPARPDHPANKTVSLFGSGRNTTFWRISRSPGREIYVIDLETKGENLCIAAVQIFGERTDRVLRLKLPLVHGEITMDLKPAQAAEASPRFTKLSRAADEIRPIVKRIQVPDSLVKVPDPLPGFELFQMNLIDLAVQVV